ncbi:TetR/AcrR family transcriptional regulator [Deltaproteobacteria bacterium TL4]
MGTVERKARLFERREHELLKAAALLFEEKGMDTVKMEDIAERMEISVGTIYQHFKSKNEIYAHLYIEKDIERLKHISQIDQDLPIIEQLRTLIKNYVTYYFENPTAYQILKSCEKRCALEKLPPEMLRKFNEQRQAGLDFSEVILQKAMEAGILAKAPVSYLSCAGWALIHGSLELMGSNYYEGKIKDWEDYFNFLESYFIQGLVSLSNTIKPAMS